MAEIKGVWTDRNISQRAIALIYGSMLIILLLPLLPLVFNRIQNIVAYALEVYPVIIIAGIIVYIYSSCERHRLLFTGNEGIVVRWDIETGSQAVLIRWNNVKRINLINSWSPKSFYRWKKIRKDLSVRLLINGFIGSRIMIIETHTDKLYFIEIQDWKGFNDSLQRISKIEKAVSEIPVLRY